MVRFNSSTWLLIVVFVNVVSAANIEETEDSLKTSFISLLKDIVNINEKRIDAMKHIDDEKGFRLGSYLSKIHKVNEESQEYETDQKAYLRIIDMRRNFNLAFKETYTQPRSMINDDAKIFLPSKRFTFKILKINKKKALKNNDKIIELPSGYQIEPGILDIINQNLRDSSENMNSRIFRKDNDIIEQPKKYLGKSSIDNIIAKLIKSETTVFQQDVNTLKLPKKYRRIPSIQDLIIICIKMNDSYLKKRNEVRQKGDIIRKLQAIINILKKPHIKDQNGNIRRKIGNHNCDDETEEKTKCEDDKKIFLCIINCCIFDGKIDVKQVKCEENDASKKKPDNVDLVFTFDDGKKGAESQWNDWSYEFADGEALSSGENKGDRQNTRKSRRRPNGKSAAKTCQRACSLVHENTCTKYKCVRQSRQAFRKECKRTCRAAFVASKESEERL